MKERTPQQIRREIALIMADGRERTADEIARRINASIGTVRANMATMIRWGLIKSDDLSSNMNVQIYRKSEAA